MKHLRLLIATGACLALVVPAAPAAAKTKTVKGTVVEKTSKKSFVLAKSSGALVQVKGARAPKVGKAVRVAGKSKAGYLKAAKVKVTGSRRSVQIAGTVTKVSSKRFVVDDGTPDVTVSRRGQSVASGDDVTVTGTIAKGKVSASDVETDGLEVDGRITAVDTAARTITVASHEGCQRGDDTSGDDATAEDSSASAPVVVHVPDTIDIGQFAVGDRVELKVAKADDGTVTLVSVGDQGAGDQGDDSSSGSDSQ